MGDFLKGSKFYPLQIVIDDREPQAIVDQILDFKNIIVRKERLPIGDYLLDSDLLVERKSVPDFCASVKDGRLFKQVAKLANSKVRPCLILEGKEKEFRETGFKKKAIQGMIISISLVFKIPIVRSKSPKQTISIMLQSYRQLTKDRLEDFRFFPRLKPKFRKSDAYFKQKVHILEGFPGIGADKAEQLLRHFGSLQNVFVSPESELVKVEGIGKTIAAQMRKVLGD
ncbi:ERCC4 domain-containing protein [Arthrospiribacter ruber]|uniref:ERCC4-type nuclease n=1 Tax=Arthrospiribacter ruber TaxID=2487934 RepID=A0A951IYU6_9BACT|nr:ERCC4 domain-containing protein [Arthrospiribacter ruber]MBW3469710.1 ERCC4-type nuclease [Arthrospiribacter ruber]